MNTNMTIADLHNAAPAAFAGLRALSEHVHQSAIEPALVELIWIRASQLNGCAFCVQMHTHAARKAGESDDRLQLLAVWRDTSFYSARERAALAWTESLTRIDDSSMLEGGSTLLREQFNETERIHLAIAVTAINAWNRNGKGTSVEAGRVIDLCRGYNATAKAAPINAVRNPLRYA